MPRVPLDCVDAAKSHFAITPSADELPVVPHALYVGGAGDVYYQGLEDEAGVGNVRAPLLNVPAGTVLPIRPLRILPQTTATGLVGLVR